MRSTRKRARHRRGSLRRNPLTSGQKALAVGGILAAGGLAAYALTRPPTSTQTTAGATPAEQAASKVAECAALQTNLAQLRAQVTPDRALMLQLEAQIAACLNQARELGVTVAPAIAHQSEGDTLFAQMDGWWNEYRATRADLDPLKRNNIRQSILNGGASLAAMYADAVAQSPNVDTTRLIAQSIVRALDAAISRQICFSNGEPGCGTFAANEDQPDVKAAQEQDRVINPLLTAYAAATTKVGGPSRAIADADGERYLAALLRRCAAFKAYIDGQFDHYRATEWSDALKRNSTRQAILAVGRDLTACLQVNFNNALRFGSLPGLRAVGALTIEALNASINRWACFFNGERGCGTFAANEDQPDVKAAQEQANTMVPLMALYAQIAPALASRGDVTAFEPLVTAKLRVCGLLKAWIDGQFAHYKATDYSDALKRNSSRGAMLAVGRSLATCLQDALKTAISAKTTALATTSSSGTSGLVGVGGYVAERNALGQFILLAPTASTAQAYAQIIAARAAQAPQVDTLKMVRQVAPAVAAAFDAAILRKLCYLQDAPGCGRLGVNEDHGNDKAAQEQAAVIGPLTLVYKQIILADKDNPQVEAPFMRALLREIEVRKAIVENQFGNLKATDYADWVKRNNIRNSIIATGRDLVNDLRNAKPVTPTGRTLLRTVAQAALTKSRERETCYRSGAGGCDRQWGTWFEPSGGEKADEEAATIGNPLAALLADRSANGLGGVFDDPLLTVQWVVVAGALTAVLGYYFWSEKQRAVRKNRRRKRSSRRLAA